MAFFLYGRRQAHKTGGEGRGKEHLLIKITTNVLHLRPMGVELGSLFATYLPVVSLTSAMLE